MFKNIFSFFKKNKQEQIEIKSKDAAKERLHLVLMQDRANVSADFLEMMKQEIIDVIKKYIEVDEKDIDVRLTNKTNDDGTVGAPALYANIPIERIKEEMVKESNSKKEKTPKVEEKPIEQEEKTTEKNQPEKKEQETEATEETKEPVPEEKKEPEEAKNQEDGENKTTENDEEIKTSEETETKTDTSDETNQ